MFHRSCSSILVCAVVALAPGAVLLRAQNPLLNAATFNSANTVLQISGLNLLGPDGLGPTAINIGKPAQIPIALTVMNAANGSINAALPAPAPTLSPGIYLLTVIYHTYTAQLNVTIGGGPQVSTTLIFPFVTNQSGFDTGMAISNASADTGSPGASGTCLLNWFGEGAPATPTQLPNISGGTDYTILASVTVPGLQGYMIAHCNFNAQGFAFVSDLGAHTLAMGYVPVVSNP